MPTVRALADRFNEKVDRSGGPEACWPWKGWGNDFGHGRMTATGGGRHLYAHRVAYEIAHGPVPDGLCVLHSCDNPPCCNPKHLWAGTKLDNSRDMSAKGRAGGGKRKGLARAVLTAESVSAIRAAHAAGASCISLGKAYGVSYVTIVHVVRRKSWKHVP